MSILSRFESRLDEFNFHLETMNLLKLENDPSLEESMESVGFSKSLTMFLLSTNPTYFNGVMLRLKLYAKRNMTNESILQELKNHKSLHPLVNYLFMVEHKVEHKVDLKSNLVSDIEEKVVDVESDEESEEENHFDRFYKELVVEDKNGMLKSKEVYERFTFWYEQNVDTEVPSKDDLKDYLTEKLGKGDKKGWKGVSLSA
jgi:hypothetical protein